jgi:hypothetical protein
VGEDRSRSILGTRLLVRCYIRRDLRASRNGCHRVSEARVAFGRAISLRDRMFTTPVPY